MAKRRVNHRENIERLADELAAAAVLDRLSKDTEYMERLEAAFDHLKAVVGLAVSDEEIATLQSFGSATSLKPRAQWALPSTLRYRAAGLNRAMPWDRHLDELEEIQIPESSPSSWDNTGLVQSAIDDLKWFGEEAYNRYKKRHAALVNGRNPSDKAIPVPKLRKLWPEYTPDD